MSDAIRTALNAQFGAAIDMLENAIRACPDELWADRAREPQVWYLAFHSLFWLDLYLTGSVDGFAPPPPFTLTEIHPDGRYPERAYTKDELLAYLAASRTKCRVTIDALTSARAKQMATFRWGSVNGVELLIYNLRHVQHGAAQLNLILRQTTDSAPRWVARSPLDAGDARDAQR